MSRWMNFSKKHAIIAGPLKGIKGDIIDYKPEDGVVELAIGDEISVMVYARDLEEVNE